jgi:hypothetical protein
MKNRNTPYEFRETKMTHTLLLVQFAISVNQVNNTTRWRIAIHVLLLKFWLAPDFQVGLLCCILTMSSINVVWNARQFVIKINMYFIFKAYHRNLPSESLSYAIPWGCRPYGLDAKFLKWTNKTSPVSPFIVGPTYPLKLYFRRKSYDVSVIF